MSNRLPNRYFPKIDFGCPWQVPYWYRLLLYGRTSRFINGTELLEYARLNGIIPDGDVKFGKESVYITVSPFTGIYSFFLLCYLVKQHARPFNDSLPLPDASWECATCTTISVYLFAVLFLPCVTKINIGIKQLCRILPLNSYLC